MICENCGNEFTPKSTVQRNCSSSNAACYLERMRRHSRKTNATCKRKRDEKARQGAITSAGAVNQESVSYA